MIEFKVGGRKVSSKQWVKALEKQALDEVMEAMADQVYGLAGSIVDPESGKHPLVRVRRTGKTGLKVSTEGSDAYAKILNERLNADGIMSESEEQESAAYVYLAHGSEDKQDAEVIRDRFMERGIDVWYDDWEIGAGESLVEKMSQGLDACTHFVVLLTPVSIEKPWVREEMNAAFVNKVAGQCKFIALRDGVEVGQLNAFVRAHHVPPVDVKELESIDRVADDILGISRKPVAARREFVRRERPGLEAWSEAAAAVAKVFAGRSDHAGALDPQLRLEELTEGSGLSEEGVRDGLLDLVDAGLVRDERYWYAPENGLFVVFDGAFMDWNPKEDGLIAARLMVNEGEEWATPEAVAEKLGWEARRLNAALYALAEARLVKLMPAMGSAPWCCIRVGTDQRTRRYVRENS